MADSKQQWIEAGIALAKDPKAVVMCPACAKVALQVTDQAIGEGKIERHLRCSGCGAYNGIRMEVPRGYSPSVTLQLLLIRSLLDRAFAAHREGSEVGNMTALLVADSACETLLKQVLTDRGAKLPESVPALLGAVETAVPSLKDHPALGHASRLRAARNPVQHSGQAPAALQVGRLLEGAHQFAATVVREAFGRDFAALSSAELVTTPDLQQGLMSAVAHLQEGRLPEANLCVAAVFEVLFARWQHWSVRAVAAFRLELEAILPRIISHVVMRVFGAEHPEMLRTAFPEDTWRDEWSLLTMGFSPSDLLRTRPLRKAAENFAQQDQSKSAPSEIMAADVAYFIDMLARQIWRLEAQFPDMLRSTRES